MTVKKTHNGDVNSHDKKDDRGDVGEAYDCNTHRTETKHSEQYVSLQSAN